MGKHVKPSELKKRAEELLESGVSRMEDFREAVPLVLQLQDAVTNVRSFANALSALELQLGELAATYAIDHVTALDEPLSDAKDGIKSGTVSINGTEYRLTVSLAPARRIDGGSFTQDFLKKLPKEWTGTKLEMRQSALKEVDPAKLAAKGLHRETKRVWSIADTPAQSEV